MSRPRVTTWNCTRPRVVAIAGHLVGDDRRALIIAEAGVNHDGSSDRALRLVDAAVEAGADVVKFQVFRAAALATAGAPTAAYQTNGARGPGRSQRDLLERLELSDRDFARIVAHCEAAGIAFLATPFSVEDVRRLVALGVPALKLASTDLNNTPLAEAAVATGLPLIVSTGAALAEEIAAAVAGFTAVGAGDRLVLLHCISSYPTPLGAANLRAIRTLGMRFGVPAGFSDHTESIRVAGWAVAAGACVLEKHFTLDRLAPGPDHAMSLSPEQLSAYIRTTRDAEAALGCGRLGMTGLEADVRAAARRSLVAAVDIAAGARLTRDMLAVKRPAGGIEPAEITAVCGRAARRAIPADTTLTWDMLQ